MWRKMHLLIKKPSGNFYFNVDIVDICGKICWLLDARKVPLDKLVTMTQGERLGCFFMNCSDGRMQHQEFIDM
jgi:hypothetical protein